MNRSYNTLVLLIGFLMVMCSPSTKKEIQDISSTNTIVEDTVRMGYVHRTKYYGTNEPGLPISGPWPTKADIFQKSDTAITYMTMYYPTEEDIFDRKIYVQTSDYFKIISLNVDSDIPEQGDLLQNLKEFISEADNYPIFQFCHDGERNRTDPETRYILIYKKNIDGDKVKFVAQTNKNDTIIRKPLPPGKILYTPPFLFINWNEVSVRLYL